MAGNSPNESVFDFDSDLENRQKEGNEKEELDDINLVEYFQMCTFGPTTTASSKNGSMIAAAAEQPIEKTASERFFERFAFVVNGYMTCAVMILGLICIGLSLAVFLRANRRPLIYYYLIGLELWNGALLIFGFLLYSLPYLVYGKHVINGPYAYSYIYSFAFSNMTLVGTVWMVLVLTVDRFLSLCYPLKHKAVSRKRVLRIISAVSLAAVLYCLPRFWEIELQTCRLVSKPVKQADYSVYVRPSPLRTTPLYHIGYKICGGMIFYSTLPFITLLMLTVKIGLELRRSLQRRRGMSLMRRRRAPAMTSVSKKPSTRVLDEAGLVGIMDENASNHQQQQQYSLNSNNNSNDSNNNKSVRKSVRHFYQSVKQRRTNAGKKEVYPKPSGAESQNSSIMLMAVVIKFLLSHSMPTLLDLIELLIGQADFSRNPTANFLVTISHLLLVLNSSTNLFIYLIWGQRFRLIFASLVNPSRDFYIYSTSAAGGTAAGAVATNGNNLKNNSNNHRSFHYSHNNSHSHNSSQVLLHVSNNNGNSNDSKKDNSNPGSREIRINNSNNTTTKTCIRHDPQQLKPQDPLLLDHHNGSRHRANTSDASFLLRPKPRPNNAGNELNSIGIGICGSASYSGTYVDHDGDCSLITAEADRVEQHTDNNGDLLTTLLASEASEERNALLPAIPPTPALTKPGHHQTPDHHSSAAAELLLPVVMNDECTTSIC